MNELGLGVATLEHDQTGRTDPDAVDATLAASGDASAFERLYRNHVPKIYGLVRNLAAPAGSQRHSGAPRVTGDPPKAIPGWRHRTGDDSDPPPGPGDVNGL